MAKKQAADAAPDAAENPAPDAAAAADAAPDAAVELVKVRVLADCAYGKANDLAEIPASELAHAEADGSVDSNEAAVAYATLLKLQPA